MSKAGFSRPLEDEVEKRLAFADGTSTLSALAKEVLRLELSLLREKHSAIFATEFLHYFTKAGLCTIRPNRPYIVTQITKRLLSYGHVIGERDVEFYLETYLDLIFTRDAYQQQRLSALQFLPKVRVKQAKVDRKRNKA